MLDDLMARNVFSSILQFSFRSKHCTGDALFYLLDYLRLQLSNSRSVPVAFLDLKKAFDRVCHHRLLVILREAGIGGLALQWIAAFLSNRTVRVVDRGGAARWQRIYHGVPQGSVLSPLLFLIFINGAARAVEQVCCNTVRIQMYADDIAVYPVPSHNMTSPVILHHWLQRALTILTSWSQQHRMVFSTDKSQVVLFGSKRSNHTRLARSWLRRHPLMLNSFPMQLVAQYQYLGLWLSGNLSWRFHEQQVIKRARSDAYLLCRIIHPSAPPYFAAVRALVRGWMIPRCTYGLEHWRPTKRGIRTLQATLAKALRSIMGLPSMTHQIGTFIEADLPSLSVLRQQRMLRYLDRVRLHLPGDHPCWIIMERQYSQFNAATVAEREQMLNGKCRAWLWAAEAMQTRKVWLPHVPDDQSVSKAELVAAIDMQSHLEWRNDPDHQSTAPLLQLKNAGDRSRFLYIERGQISRLRARLRAGRAMTMRTRARFAPPADQVSPVCTEPYCATANIIEDEKHILLECPRHFDSREIFLRRASMLLSGAATITQSTLALILGATNYDGTHVPLSQYRTLLSHSAEFLRNVCAERFAAGLPWL